MQRTFCFGVDILKFLMTLRKNDIFGIIIFQLGKSATSRGSNYEEAQGAESPQDFNHKIGIVLKEVGESNYWLRVLKEVIKNSSSNDELMRLFDESIELKKIFSTIKIKAQNKLNS